MSSLLYKVLTNLYGSEDRQTFFFLKYAKCSGREHKSTPGKISIGWIFRGLV